MIKDSLSTLTSSLNDPDNPIWKNLMILIKKMDKKPSYPKIFSVKKDLGEILNHIEDIDKIISIGLYFGKIKKGKFLLSLEGAEYLYSLEKINNSRLFFVKEEAEKSLLYGNDLKKGMLLKMPSKREDKKLFLVLNDHQELIGITRTNTNFSKIEDLDDEATIATNLIDKGYYLRTQ